VHGYPRMQSSGTRIGFCGEFTRRYGHDSQLFYALVNISAFGKLSPPAIEKAGSDDRENGKSNERCAAYRLDTHAGEKSLPHAGHQSDMGIDW